MEKVVKGLKKLSHFFDIQTQLHFFVFQKLLFQKRKSELQQQLSFFELREDISYDNNMPSMSDLSYNVNLTQYSKMTKTIIPRRSRKKKTKEKMSIVLMEATYEHKQMSQNLQAHLEMQKMLLQSYVESESQSQLDTVEDEDEQSYASLLSTLSSKKISDIQDAIDLKRAAIFAINSCTKSLSDTQKFLLSDKKKKTAPSNQNPSFENFDLSKAKQIKTNEITSFKNMFSTCMNLRPNSDGNSQCTFKNKKIYKYCTIEDDNKENIIFEDISRESSVKQPEFYIKSHFSFGCFEPKKALIKEFFQNLEFMIKKRQKQFENVFLTNTKVILFEQKQKIQLQNQYRKQLNNQLQQLCQSLQRYNKATSQNIKIKTTNQVQKYRKKSNYVEKLQFLLQIQKTFDMISVRIKNNSFKLIFKLNAKINQIQNY